MGEHCKLQHTFEPHALQLQITLKQRWSHLAADIIGIITSCILHISMFNALLASKIDYDGYCLSLNKLYIVSVVLQTLTLVQIYYESSYLSLCSMYKCYRYHMNTSMKETSYNEEKW